MESIQSQTYKNKKVIVSCDCDQSWKQAVEYFENQLECVSLTIRVSPNTGYNHYWNLYSNKLKSFVADGWFFYLDNDDFLHNPNSLSNIVPHLINPGEGVICQFLRNGKPKPRKELMEQGKIESGRIGAPCLFLHHSKKDIANWDGNRAADFRWIKAVSEKLPMKFVQTVVVEAGNNGLHGK